MSDGAKLVGGGSNVVSYCQHPGCRNIAVIRMGHTTGEMMYLCVRHERVFRFATVEWQRHLLDVAQPLHRKNASGFLPVSRGDNP